MTAMTPFHTTDGTIHLEQIPRKAITAPAIGSTLAKINRFAGRTPVPWSVALHSVLVSRLCQAPEEQAWGLLHDAHEAFMGDIITPAVSFMAHHNGLIASNIIRNAVHQAKSALDRQIAAAWDIRTAELSEVVEADRIAYLAERFIYFDVAPGAEDHDEVERAVHMLRELPQNAHWMSANEIWCQEARRLAHVGVLTLPEENHL